MEIDRFTNTTSDRSNYGFTYFTTDNSTSLEEDITNLAKCYVMYKIGDILNKYYFPILIPFGTTGNILSFLVMVQPHNRIKSISLYISSIAVVDTIVLLIGLTSYLNVIYDVHMPPHRTGYCNISNFSIFTVFLCSTLLIAAMTLERFYSIIKPHKAASFNTVKRAKITIVSIVTFTILYNVPHLFLSSVQEKTRQCLPYGKGQLYGQLYYWLSFVVSFALPFVLLLTMNSVIIHQIRNRGKFMVKPSRTEGKSEGQCQDQGQVSEIKNSEKQIYAILLLASFGVLMLTTPAYILFIFTMVVDFTTSPELFAGYYLLYNIAQKLYYTNHGINFFLYVISGNKFRRDLVNLFKGRKGKDNFVMYPADADTKSSHSS